jgi:hypothetical protein
LFYRDLLRGMSEADQQIRGLYEVPDLTARWDYDRDSLAADLGLARDDPGMAGAADTYLAAAREEFWRPGRAGNLCLGGGRRAAGVGREIMRLRSPASGAVLSTRR